MGDTWAAKVLADVYVYRYDTGDLISKADALAAIARMGAGDGLVERLLDWSEFDEGKINDTREEAAAHIAALTAERNELKAWKRYWQGEFDVVLAGRSDAEAEAAALRAKVARLEGALRPFCFFNEDEPESDVQHAWEIRYQDRFKDWIDFGDIVAARAAISEGAADQREGGRAAIAAVLNKDEGDGE